MVSYRVNELSLLIILEEYMIRICEIYNSIFIKMGNIKNKCFKIIISIIMLIVYFSLLILMIFFQKNILFFGYVLTLLMQLVTGLFLLGIFIPVCINKKDKNRIGAAVVTNLFFSISTTMLVISNTYFDKLLYHILSIFVLFLTIFIIYKCIEVETGDDLTILKAVNYFTISIYSVIIFLLGQQLKNDKVLFFINYIYLLPLLIVQGLYELLDGKTQEYQNVA